VLGARFIYFAVRVWRTLDEKLARRMFGFSILYLTALFAVMLFDQLLG
jgi:heme o synthase